MPQSPKIRWWQWPNVLALDAALVGVGWLLLVGDALWLAYLLRPAAVVLGLSIWLVYTADRWLDVRKLGLKNIPTARHAFIKRCSRWVPALWVAAFIFTFILALRGLELAQLLHGLALLALAVLHTWLTRKRYFRLPLKEIVVGVAFAWAILVFLWSQAAVYKIPLTVSPDRVLLVVASALFGLLCFANCALIAEREREIDVALGRSSIALRFPNKRILWAGLAVMASLLGCLFLPQEVWGINAALALSGAILGLLGILMEYFPPELFRVLADAAMLTPWVVVLI